MPSHPACTRPDIAFGPGPDALLGGAYRAALTNLLDINTVPYDRAARTTGPGCWRIRPGRSSGPGAATRNPGPATRP
jgi:hypothetical protein